jgi:acyl-CoA thioesterase YciA
MHNDPAIKVMMMPKDTNPHGIIFGGVLLSYIDQAGAIHAEEAGKAAGVENIKFVTIAMDKIEFRKPVQVGDVVSFFVETIKVGKSSIVVHVLAYANHIPLAEGFVTQATLVFVAVDENQKPVEVFKG